MRCYVHYWECPVWQTEETEPREYESRIAEIFQQDLSDYFRSLSLAETVSYAITIIPCKKISFALFSFLDYSCFVQKEGMLLKPLRY